MFHHHQHLNEHAGPRNENALSMLRAKKVPRGTAVWTADDRDIGYAIRLHHRQDDVNPDLKLYASYLEIFSKLFGSATYIPTDFIRDYDPAENKQISLKKLGIGSRYLLPKAKNRQSHWSKDRSNLYAVV